MSFGKLTALGERLTQRRSMDSPGKIVTPRQVHGDDYVLVGDSVQESESNKGSGGSQDDQSTGDSPKPVALQLNVPSGDDDETKDSPGEEISVNLGLNNASLLTSWKEQSPASEDGSSAQGEDASAATDCTDYSGLNETTPGKDSGLQQALERANQQHEWAMEAVILGWEAEKAELLNKLEKTTEARDTLEAELKHREDNFAGMLDSMLDQKLDQMLQLLQESGIPPQTPPSSRSSFSSASPSQPPTVKKAQKVVTNLSSIMDAMKNQQAEVEEQVVGLRAAIIQLLPEDEEERRRFLDSINPDYLAKRRAPNRAKASLRRLGSTFHSSKTFVREQVPRLVRASSSAASRAVSAPVNFSKVTVKRVGCYCQSKGIRNEHLTAVAGIVAGILVSSLLVKSNARKDTRILAHEDKPVEHVSSSEEIDFTREEAEGAKEDAEQGSECMHIIFSGNGIYKRTTYDSSPSLMFAWPKIVLDYR